MQKIQSKKETSWFLFTRGLFLIFLEITFVNFAWTFQFPIEKLYLQVIWAIGLSMISLSLLIYISKKYIFLISISIILGHNLLDNIHFTEDSIFYIPWAILLDPTSACNLHCTGCWAAEYGNKLNLTFDEIDSIIEQGKELGIYFYIYTGGEPLVRKNDLIALCKKHSDCIFIQAGNFLRVIRL